MTRMLRSIVVLTLLLLVFAAVAGAAPVRPRLGQLRRELVLPLAMQQRLVLMAGSLAAEGKHAMYPTQSACNSGGFFGADDCGDNRCWVSVGELIQKLMNVGENNARFYDVIPYPAPARDMAPYDGLYSVWSGNTFGSATSYRENLLEPLAWCSSKCY